MYLFTELGNITKYMQLYLLKRFKRQLVNVHTYI